MLASILLLWTLVLSGQEQQQRQGHFRRREVYPGLAEEVTMSDMLLKHIGHTNQVYSG